MKIIHTSDWHLGRTIYGRGCHNEFQAFLQWLIIEIEQQKADCLLIAGDIFDNTTPSNTTQSNYYSFLHEISATCCRHIVIIGGNHDSPSLLNAPRELLKHLNINVIGSITDRPEDEIIVLCAPDGSEELMVCAVPYLRDRDIRKAEAGETVEDKAGKLITGIAKHYQLVIDAALRKRKECGWDIPIVAMGHLFTSGGKILDNNEVRELYVGSLAHLHASHFPKEIDYLALGHLHIAQCVNDNERIRYCGSPLQFSFGKNNRDKSITAVNITETISIETIPVPPFLRLQTISGNRQEIMKALEDTKKSLQNVLVEIVFTGQNIASLKDSLGVILDGSNIELIRVVHRRLLEQAQEQKVSLETLKNLTEFDVFRRCLDINSISEPTRQELEYCFADILKSIAEEDSEKEKE